MPFNLAVPGAVIRADQYNENLSRTVATDDPRTIIVPHVFNPSVPGAPFVLGVNAQGQLVTGLNADLVDGQHASAFAAASHKSQHATGGADPLAPADIGAVATTRQVLAGTGLTGGGDLSADRTLAIDTAVVPRKNVAETITGLWTFSGAIAFPAATLDGAGGNRLTFGATGVAHRGRARYDGNGLFITQNAEFTGGVWVRDDTTEPSFAIAVGHMGTDRLEIRATPAGTGNISWTNALVIQPDGRCVFARQLVPSGDGTIDLGETGARWRDLHLSGTVKGASDLPRKNVAETITSPWTFGAGDAALSLSAGFLLARGGDGIFDGSSWHNTALVMAGLKYVGTQDPASQSVYLKDVGSAQYGGAMLMVRANGGSAARGFYFYVAPNSTGAGTTAVTTEVLRITETTFNYLGGKVWHQANDGPGSGLDADLVDGQHASAFAAASHTHSAADIISGTLGVARGGTGLASYAAGDLIYATGATTLARRAIGSTNQVLAVVSGAPAWQTPSGGGQVVGTGRQIATGTGLQGGGDLSANRTLSVKPADFVTVSTSPPSGTPAAGVGALWAQVS